MKRRQRSQDPHTVEMDRFNPARRECLEAWVQDGGLWEVRWDRESPDRPPTQFAYFPSKQQAVAFLDGLPVQGVVTFIEAHQGSYLDDELQNLAMNIPHYEDDDERHYYSETPDGRILCPRHAGGYEAGQLAKPSRGAVWDRYDAFYAEHFPADDYWTFRKRGFKMCDQCRLDTPSKPSDYGIGDARNPSQHPSRIYRLDEHLRGKADRGWNRWVFVVECSVYQGSGTPDWWVRELVTRNGYGRTGWYEEDPSGSAGPSAVWLDRSHKWFEKDRVGGGGSSAEWRLLTPFCSYEEAELRFSALAVANEPGMGGPGSDPPEYTVWAEPYDWPRDPGPMTLDTLPIGERRHTRAGHVFHFPRRRRRLTPAEVAAKVEEFGFEGFMGAFGPALERYCLNGEPHEPGTRCVYPFEEGVIGFDERGRPVEGPPAPPRPTDEELWQQAEERRREQRKEARRRYAETMERRRAQKIADLPAEIGSPTEVELPQRVRFGDEEWAELSAEPRFFYYYSPGMQGDGRAYPIRVDGDTVYLFDLWPKSPCVAAVRFTRGPDGWEADRALVDPDTKPDEVVYRLERALRPWPQGRA